MDLLHQYIMAIVDILMRLAVRLINKYEYHIYQHRVYIRVHWNKGIYSVLQWSLL